MKALMIQGTASGVGKTLLVAGLCRLLCRRGLAVAPFKPQNMALNSAVTVDGGEIGRAQALQAKACGLEPHSDMNPVLLKPTSDTGSQLIVQGRVREQVAAADYHHLRAGLLKPVLESFRRLGSRYPLVIVEGAGSPAEINLRQGDIANMGFALAADCPVLLVGDIDRGGVFAQLIGTLELLSEAERAQLAGFIINRFRGDPQLLGDAPRWLAQRLGKPFLGLLPFLPELLLEEEDSMIIPAADRPADPADEVPGSLRVVVIRLPHLSNHSDFDSLRRHPRVRLCWSRPGRRLPAADLLILPGSKAVRADLAWLRAQGWEPELLRHLRFGGRLLGICGGFQMLGQTIADPDGVEGAAGTSQGLGLLEMDTRLTRHKRLRQVQGWLADSGAAVTGYEIHAGRSRGRALDHPALRLGSQRLPEGCQEPHGSIMGSYVHGLFDREAACAALLSWAGLPPGQGGQERDQRREQDLERLADAMERHLDMAAIYALLGLESDMGRLDAQVPRVSTSA